MKRLARCIAVLLLVPALHAAAEVRAVPGTRVRLQVPEGFALAPELPGIGRAEELTSVVVTELPLPLARALPDFTAEALAERGLELFRRGDVEIGPHRGTLFHATQRAGGITFRKWLLLFGDDTSSVLITATAPLDLEARHHEALVRVLRTAVWDPAQPRAQSGPLRFRVDEVPPFEIVTTGTNAVVLGDPQHEGEGIPSLVVAGSSLGRVHVGDLPDFARTRLEQTPTLEEIAIREEGEARLAGLPAWEIRGEARDSASGGAVRVHQILTSDAGHYFMLQGIVDAQGDVEGFAQAFREIAGSFALEPR